MRIAHISDLHLLGTEEISPRRLVGKRFTGWVNLRFRRNAVHKSRVAQAVAREVRQREVDHVVITGDMTNLALESEFEAVRAFLEQDLGMPPESVSVVPGNHDAYTRGSHRSRRFQCYLGEYITSDLPGATGVPDIGRFPYVRLRGPAAIIGLSTAIPRLPLVASGMLGRAQCMALQSLLQHDDVRSRSVVILQHHPWHAPPTPMKAFTQGLVDAPAQRDVLRELERGLLLHGHLHRRLRRPIETDNGHIEAVGTTSASLVDEREDRMSGFNVYDIGDDGDVSMTAYRLDPETESFVETGIPASNL